VSYGIIKEHAGKVDVRSTPDKARPSGSNSQPHGSGSCLRGAILVVDDELEIREGWSCCSRRRDTPLRARKTGEAGLTLLEEKPFDLLLLDVSLPDRNGLDLLREIRRRDPHLSVD